MKFTFKRWATKFYSASHPDTTEVGFGATKYQAVVDLESVAGMRFSAK